MFILNNTQFNENHTTETLGLSEEVSPSTAEGVVGYLRTFFKKIRTNFSIMSERSLFSALLENLYIRSLSSKTRVASVFLLSFSIVSLIISYALNESFSRFISDIDTFSSLVLIIVSTILFTTNRTFHELINSSKLLGSLSIVYSEQGIILSKGRKTTVEYPYSTPFFLGIICGIFTVVYPVSVICSFIVSLICVLLVVNRPECGMLIVISFLPFLSRPLLLTFACIIFLSLVYRYLLGKRHINFDVSSLLMLISVIYISARCFMVDGDVISRRLYIYTVFFVSCFSAINLIRTTAMFRRTIQVLVRMMRFFAVILVIYYLCNIFFGTNTVNAYLSLLNIPTLTASLTTASFVAPFLVMAVPVNFAYMIGGSGSLKNAVYFILLFACLVYVSSYAAVLICILSCVVILAIYNKRFLFLAIPAPLAAFALISVFNAVPPEYRLSATAQRASDFEYAKNIIKLNPFFGSGPEITDFSGNILLNILMTFGIAGLLLLFGVLLTLILKSARSVFTKAHNSRFLSVGLLCASISFIALCAFTDINCDMNTIYLFSVIISAYASSAGCFEADYIDKTMVREYNNK